MKKSYFFSIVILLLFAISLNGQTKAELIKKYLPESLQETAASYSIPEDMYYNDKDIIILILQSRSIDTHEEKQNWFHLYPLMNDEQIEKLRKILLKEKRKLAEIEAKYERKKEEIKNKYLKKWIEEGYIKTASILMFGKMDNQVSLYILGPNNQCRDVYDKSKVHKVEDLDLLSIDDVESFYGNKEYIFNGLLKEYYKRLFNNIPQDINSIERNIKLVNVSEITTKEIKNTLVKNYKYISKNFRGIKLPEECSQLLSLPYENLIENQNRKKYAKEYRQWALREIYEAMYNYSQYCSEFDDIVSDFRIKSPHDFSMAFFHVFLYNNSNSCLNIKRKLRSRIVESYSAQMDTINIELKKKNYINFELHGIHLDIYDKLYPNDDLNYVVEIMKNKVLKYLKDNPNKFSSTWYKNLHYTIINKPSFKYSKTLSQLETEFNKLASKSLLKGSKEKDPAKMEYLCYYGIYQILDNPNYNKKEVRKILNKVKLLGNDPTTDAYYYMEKNFANFFEKLIKDDYVSRDVNNIAIWLNPDPVKARNSIDIYEPNIDIKLAIKSNIELNNSNFELFINSNKNYKFGEADIKEKYISQQYLYTFTKKIYFSEPGQYKIKLKVRKNNKTITNSETITFNYFPKKINLYVLSIGTNPADLQYTGDDANDFSNLFKSQQIYDKITIKKLIGSNATKRNILIELSRIKALYKRGELTKRDMVMVFISSHGSDYDNNFLIHANDFSTIDKLAGGIIIDDIFSRLRDVKTKKMLFIDACHSGTLDPSLLVAGSKDASYHGLVNARKRLLESKPGWVFLTSSGDEFSWEHPDWHNGSFTEAISEGLKGCKADKNNNSLISIKELEYFLKNRVPQLNSNVGFPVQTPVIYYKGFNHEIEIYECK